jgi:DNA polymerase-3 subunit epsilon
MSAGERLVVLDTETTGLEVSKGHRVIEIGCIELIERRPTGRQFHRYLNPEREIDAGAQEVTGLTLEFLADKPLFAEIVDEFLAFVAGAELIIHNADFDVGFLNAELQRAGAPVSTLAECSRITDTLAMARERYPGKRNSLDALCSRLDIDNAHRTLHGALLDAQLLAEVFLAMTSGQADLALLPETDQADSGHAAFSPRAIGDRPPIFVRRASLDELRDHQAMLDRLDKASGGSLWRRLAATS